MGENAQKIGKKLESVGFELLSMFNWKKKMGVSMNKAASTIMNEARSKSRTKGFAAHISRYATTNAHEAISEAFSDVYCNGSKANNASKLVVNTLNKYLKRK